MACFNSGQRLEDHFVDINEMVEIGSGAQRSIKTVMMSRYACYLVIQNADPGKEIVALGQSYFANQTRRQELSDLAIEDQRRLLLRAEIKQHNIQLADAAKGAGVIEPSTTRSSKIMGTWGSTVDWAPKIFMSASG
jgi:DNA-damage-inducible protein D